MNDKEATGEAGAEEPLREAETEEPVREAGAEGPGAEGPGAEADGTVRESPAARSGPAPLSPLDRDVLALEGESFAGPGAKERAVRERLGMSPTRYYQLLNALLDDPAAEAHAPVTVHRLRRVREARRAER
ncbi:DUF3263 domain-containing protein [Streptomyces sp. NRRL F-5630]|uniref:DUF3263 domain-containing protein n=1 Tax=Streptomyces sp. NRRL F-5630 TaxID=1463864 RepID=UPI003EB79C52